jgi:uncharacterized RDD family membrane protein YckC
MYPLENESSLLDIELELELNKEPASKGQRFVNYIIDFIMYLVFLFAFLILAAIIWQLIKEFADKNSKAFNTMFDISILSLYAPFYAFSEWVSHGRSVGKFITKTKAIRLDGNKFSLKDALLRSLIRLIPIEPFTAFSDRGPWHDRWTKTRVVKK